MSWGKPDTPVDHPGSGSASVEARLIDFVSRHYRLLAGIVLLLAAFNLTYRLGLESVEEWDESLYATTAWEMLRSGDLIGTTFGGQLDYYNSKPPLNVWLIAAMFATFGVNLVSLRAVSAACAWLTVLTLQMWTRREFGPTVSLLSSLVLSTSFGFIHLHAGRSGNPDALLTLLLLLTVVVLSVRQRRPWQRAWLGPILAGVFLLKGMAVLLPLLVIVMVEAISRGPRTWKPLLAAGALFVAPAGAWMAARWRVDQWTFFERMFNQDFLALTSTAVEERFGGPLFYADVLQKYHYEWLLAGVGAALLARHSWGPIGRALRVSIQQQQPTIVSMGAWATATLLVPTLVQTKLTWYLNPFYPLFAVVVGMLLANVAFNNHGGNHGRRLALAGVLIVVAIASAQARSLWRIHVITNLETSVQGVLLSKSAGFKGTRVCRDGLQRAEMFVVRAMMNSTFHVMTGAGRGGPPKTGDLYVFSREVLDPRLRPVGQADGHFVYEAN